MLNLSRSHYRRRMAAACVSVVVSLSLAGCVPIAANEQPLAMTVQDDHVLFRWCGSESLTGGHLEITYALIRGTEREDRTAAEGSGHFSLTSGDEFSEVTPPPDVTFSVARQVPFTNGARTLVFVFSGPDADSNDFQAMYEIDDEFSKLRDGYWMQPTGETSRAPCPAN